MTPGQSREQFRQDTIIWLLARGLPADADPLEAAFAIGRHQILRDVRTGRVPASVASFSELHDHVDANYYGHAFRWPCLPSEDRDDAYQWAFTHFWNEVQNRLHEWIVSGEMRRETENMRIDGKSIGDRAGGL